MNLVKITNMQCCLNGKRLVEYKIVFDQKPLLMSMSCGQLQSSQHLTGLVLDRRYGYIFYFTSSVVHEIDSSGVILA